MRSTAFIVFLFPLVSTIMFGTLVMGEVLKLPERELKLLQINEEKLQNNAIKINGIKNEYETSSPINVNILVEDQSFECGDLFLSIYKIVSTTKELITQSGFFGQCFIRNNVTLPINDEFVEIINSEGEYEIIVEMHDKHYKKLAIASHKFLVSDLIH